jgi:Flp pilus assembly protein CpaB
MARKNEQKTWPLLVGAVGFGIVAALLSVVYLKSREAAILASLKGPDIPDVNVVVARQDLPRGQTISPELFAVRPIPQTFVHNDAVFPHEFERYVGQVITTNLGSGRSLLKSFVDSDFPVDFSDIIGEGKRAMTVTVDEVNSIGGHLRPGNLIDLYVNIPFGVSGFSPKMFTAGLVRELPRELKGVIPQELLTGAIGTEMAEEIIALASPTDVILPVVQTVRVLATGRDPYQDTLDALRQPQMRREGHFSTITVEVTPEQAALITMAQDKGEMLALLRHRRDRSASSFTAMSPRDLFSNASNMAAAEQERASRAAVGGAVDVAGNLVGADGRRIASRAELAAAGFTVNERGQVVDRDGNVVDPQDIVVGPGGKIVTRQQLAAAGLTVNESGQIVDSNGNVVSAADIVIGPDGKVMTKQQLAAAGLTVNERGEIVDGQGRVVAPGDLITTADGKVMTKQSLAAAGLSAAAGLDAGGNLVDASGKVLASRAQLEAAGMTIAGGTDASGNLVDASGNVIASREALEAAGYTVDAGGRIIDRNGNVVDPSTLLVGKDGKVLDSRSVVVDKNGNIMSADDVQVAADGNVLSTEQLAAAGLRMNDKGQIVDRNGNVVDAADLVVSADGKVMTRQELAAAGLSINEQGQVVDAAGNVVSSADLIRSPDGTILSRQQLEAAGLKVNDKGEIVDASGRVLSAAEVATVAQNIPISGVGTRDSYDLIIGGASKDGVPKAQVVPVEN